MIETSVLFAFAAILCWGLGDFFIQRTTRKIGDVESLFFIGLFGSIVLLPWAWSEIGLLTLDNTLFLILMGGLTFVVALLLFEALRKGKLAIIDVLFEIELPVTIVLGLFFFREILSLQQTLLIGTVFAGIILLSMQKLSLRHHFSGFEKGVLLAVAGAIGMGILNFFTAAAARDISPLLSIWGPWVVFTGLSLGVILHRNGIPALIQHAKTNKLNIFAEGLFDTFSWVFFAFALASGSLSIVTAITESYPAIGVLLGIWFNKEHIEAHQFLGAGIALAGSIGLGLL